MTSHPRPPTAADLADTAHWFTSSYSGNGTNCVEIADLTGTRYAGVAVRDSKRPSGPALLLPPARFAAFVASVRAGHYTG